MIQHSQAVSDFLDSHPDHYKEIKKLAVICVVSRRALMACQEFYDTLKERGHVGFDMCYGEKKQTSSSLVFVGDEQAVMKELNAMSFKPKKHVPAPPSVVVKMIALRMKKFDEIIETWNNSITSYNAWAASQPNNKGIVRPLLDKLAFADIDDIKHGRLNKWAGYNHSHEIGNLVKVLNHKNATPDVIEKAWNEYSVLVVMKS